MTTTGYFGYILGKKQRMMFVQSDADLMWKILVREIYVIMKHYNTIDKLKEVFEKIKVIKNKPNSEQIEKCKYFSEINNITYNDKNNNWQNLLRYCQSSYINLLESKYIINDLNLLGYIFVLDLNKGIIRFYLKSHIKDKDKDKELNSITIKEIMDFDEMPTKTYNEIIIDMKENYDIYNSKIVIIHDEMIKLNSLKENCKKQGALNVEEKIDKLINDNQWEEKKINFERRFFYNRLKALDLIENDDK